MRLFRSVAFVAAVVLSVAATGQKPIVDHPFQVETRLALATLDQIWSASDLVVEGVIDGSKPTDYGPWPQITTTYTCRIVEVFKGKASLPPIATTVDIRRTGGVRESDTRIDNYEPTNYPLFKDGQRFVFFLTRHEWVPPAPFTGVFYTETTRGPDSAFEVRGKSLFSNGRGSVSKAIGVLGPDSLRQQLRGKGGNK